MLGSLGLLLSVISVSANDAITTLDGLPMSSDVSIPQGLQEAILRASDAQGSDRFGWSVALSGDTALVGADEEDTGGDLAGAAYVFVRDGSGAWSEQAILRASDAQDFDSFGVSVALSGDTALVGAEGENTGGMNAGAAYIFVRDGSGNWSEQAILRASDAQTNDFFGAAVALSGDTALVGAYGADTGGSRAGAAYVFVRDGSGNWSEQAILRTSDAQAYDNFGESVALSGDTALVGADQEDTGDNNAGAAYVFVRDGNGAWSEQAILRTSDAQAYDYFGESVALSGDTALVGASLEDTANSNAGAAYVFVHDGNGAWSEQAILRASDAQAFDYFGRSVALNGGTALVGAHIANTGFPDDGAAYVFVRDGNGAWSEQAILRASDTQLNDGFGWSVGLSGNTALVGASFKDADGTDAGAAYTFTLGNQQLIQNGGFDAGLTNWRLFGDYGSQLVNGVVEFWRLNPGWRGASLFQEIDQFILAGSPLRINVSLANSGNVDKSVVVMLRDPNFDDVISCGVTLPPNSTFQSVTIEDVTTIDWASAVFSVRVLDQDDTPAVRVDNVSVGYLPDSNISDYRCDGYDTPDNQQLARNGDFSTQFLREWIMYGDYDFTTDGDTLTFYRTGTRVAALFQNMAHQLDANAQVTAQVDIGNTGSTAKDVTLLFRSESWSDILQCKFTVPADTPLTTVTLQGNTSAIWEQGVFTVRIDTNDNEPALVVDNVLLQYDSAISGTATTCDATFSASPRPIDDGEKAPTTIMPDGGITPDNGGAAPAPIAPPNPGGIPEIPGF